jgi:hypothetical protein
MDLACDNLPGGILPLSGSRDKEIFENERSFTPAKGAAARAAGYFAVICRRGLYPHDLIKGATVGTLEGRRLRLEHVSLVSQFVAI